jgi:hypothetical protein
MFMRLSLTKAAHAFPFSAAKQKIPVRFGATAHHFPNPVPQGRLNLAQDCVPQALTYLGGLKKNTRTPINRVPVFTLSSKAKPSIVCFKMGIEFRQALVVSFLIATADRSCKELDTWASNREPHWHKLLSAVLSTHHADGNFKFREFKTELALS